MQKQPEPDEILSGLSKAIHEKMLICQQTQNRPWYLIDDDKYERYARKSSTAEASVCYAELRCMLKIYRQARDETFFGQTTDRPHFKL